MVKLVKILGFSFFFMSVLIYSLPKVSLYYALEKELELHKVVSSNEEVMDKGFYLALENLSPTYDAIEVANIQSVTMVFFIFYNTISAKNIDLTGMATSFIPTHIDTLSITYSFLNPLYIVGDSQGEFGVANAKIDLLDRRLTLILQPSKLMLQKYRRTLGKLQKNKDGEYTYEKTF